VGGTVKHAAYPIYIHMNQIKACETGHCQYLDVYNDTFILITGAMLDADCTVPGLSVCWHQVPQEFLIDYLSEALPPVLLKTKSTLKGEPEHL